MARAVIPAPQVFGRPGVILGGADTGAQGMRVRLIPIPGVTPREVLLEQLVLPAVLDEFEVSGEAAHNDYTTVRAGEFSAPGGGEKRSHRRLRTSDLEALTLIWHAPWLQSLDQDPKAVHDALWRIHDYRKPVLLAARIRQQGWEDEVLRMPVTVRSLRERVRKGEPDTRYFSIATKEWRDNSVRRRGRGVGRGKVRLPARHKLDSNDTLHSLAKHYYGSYAGWRTIRNENKIPTSWGQSTPLVQMKRFKVGSVVRIPKKPPSATTAEAERGL